jgi:hypothetical protein
MATQTDPAIEPTAGKRHRWKSLDTYLPNKHWRCIRCDLLKETEYDSDNLYSMRDGRTWHRFAPPCPPDAESRPTVCNPP